MIERKTILSDDRVYRYTLWREWGCDLFEGDGVNRDRGYAMFIGLNPSTADETKDDPTIRKCVGFARRWGYGALCMTNLFAFRATDPAVMKKSDFPAGPANHSWLLRCASEAGVVVAAWGKHGRHHNQDLNVRQMMSSISVRLQCLKVNLDGSPQHPLYIPYETAPKEYVPMESQCLP